MLKVLDELAVPTADEVRLASTAGRALAAEKGANGLRVRLVDSGTELVLPHSASRLLIHILTEMAQGNAVTIIPVHAELTTQEAADFLNVSRPYLIKLINSGQLAHRLVGTHRRIRFEDLSEFKRNTLKEARAKLDELTAEAQELDLGY